MPKKPCILNKSAVKRLFADAGMPKPIDETIDIMSTNLTSIFRVIARTVPLRQIRKNTVTTVDTPMDIVTPEEVSVAVPVGRVMDELPPDPAPSPAEEPAKPLSETTITSNDKVRITADPPGDTHENPVALAVSLGIAPLAPAYKKPVLQPGDTPCTQCMYAAHGTDGSIFCRNELAEAYRTRVGTTPLVVGCSLGELLTDDNLSGDSDDDGTTPPATV
jgi:hypothetical protein